MHRSWLKCGVLALAVAIGRPGVAHAQSRAGPVELRLRPGDLVRLEVKDEPELSGQYPVGGDGRILLPLVGFVDVAGRPFGEVMTEVGAAYAVQLVDPVLRLTPLPRIAILGEVRAPGLYPADPSYTVADALAAAGGLTPSANRRHISLVRGGQVLVARLDPRSPTLELPLQSGDQILVGRRGWLAENASILIGAVASVAAAAVTSLIVR